MAWVFWGLALVWGQTATAWKWHAAAESLDATPTPSYIPKWGWVRVLGDTVYIMGTYTGNNQRLGLPTTGSPMSTAFPEGTAYVRTYLAAYNRQNGRLAWWMWFYRPLANCWGTDIQVDPQGRVLLLLISHDNVHWEYRDTTGTSAAGSFTGNGVGGDRYSYLVRVQAQVGASPTVTSTFAGISSGPTGSYVDLKHLVQVGGHLYASGSFLMGSSLLSLSLGGNLIPISLPLGTSIEQALIVRFDANTLNMEQVGQLHAQQLLLRYAVRGHALAFNPTSNQIHWLVETQATSGTFAYRDTSGSLNNSVSVAGEGLWAVTLDSDLEANSFSALWLAETPSLGSSPFLRLKEDTLVWAIADSRTYTIQGSGGLSTSSSHDRILLVEQKLTPSVAVVRSWESPQFANGIQLFDVGVEPGRGFVYLAGQAKALNWGTLLGNLPLAEASNLSAGYLLGLRSTGTTYGVLGYRRFWARSHDAGLVAMAYEPSRAQFYLLGLWEDSLVVRPRWPEGEADTLILNPGVSPSLRLWLGRLDWYRLETSDSRTACVPDTLEPNFALTWTGTSTGEDTAFVWMPDSLALRYHPHQALAFREGWRFAVPVGQEGRRTGSAPLYALGRYPLGRYFLTQRVKALPRIWADVIDTLWLSVTGTTVPELGRSGVYRDSRIVVPFVGYATASAQASLVSTPFYRRDSVRFQSITALAYFPWQAGRERLYVYDARYLYGVDLATGQVERAGPFSPAFRPLMDRGRGHLLFRTGLDFYPSPSFSHPLLQKNLGTPSYLINQAQVGYPLRYDSTWVASLIQAAFLPSGDLVLVAEARPSTSAREGSLFRVSFAADSVWRVTGRPSAGTCPQDGVGDAAYLTQQISTLAVEEDTIYWIEQIPAGCPNTQTWILRRAFPETGNPRTYRVQTIDTLLRVASLAPGQVEFASQPDRSLVFFLPVGGGKRLVRYHLQTRQVDTLLWERGGGGGCGYGPVNALVGVGEPFALLRGGAIVLAGGSGQDLRIALPAYGPGMGDTLRAEGSLTTVGGEASWTLGSGADTLYVTPPASPGGEDSTRFTAAVGCTGKSAYYGSYRLPPVQLWLQGPDTVCEGMVFHTLVGRDTEYVLYGCRVTHRLTNFSATGPLAGLMVGNEVTRWKATAVGSASVSVSTVPIFRWLVGSGLTHSIQVTPGHRLRLRLALEGPYDSTGGRYRLRPHPFLNRLTFAGYQERTLAISPDSLWRLPFIRGDSLAKAWNLLLIEPSGGCPGAGSWWCSQDWSGVARVELRESPTGPVVDSAYALIDTVGRLYFWHAPVGSVVGASFSNADTLHFCRCDPSTPKYVAVRFPGHLPLHTPALTLGSLGIGRADSLDLTDPSSLEGIPGENYTLLWDPVAGRMRAAAWAGNCADLYNGFLPGPHVDAGQINAADYEFYLPRNGITTGFSWADLDSDGDVDAADGVLLLLNQNALRQSSQP